MRNKIFFALVILIAVWFAGLWSPMQFTGVAVADTDTFMISEFGDDTLIVNPVNDDTLIFRLLSAPTLNISPFSLHGYRSLMVVNMDGQPDPTDTLDWFAGVEDSLAIFVDIQDFYAPGDSIAITT